MAVEGGPIAEAAVELVAHIGGFDDDVRLKVTAAAAAAGKDFDKTLREETKGTGKKVGEQFGEQAKRETAKSGKDAGGGWAQAFKIAIAGALTRKTLNSIFAPLRVVAGGVGLGLVAAEAASAIGPILNFAAAASQAVGVVAALPAALSVAAALFGTVAVATGGMGDAFKAASSGDAKKLDAALKDLAPEAANVVREFAGVRPRLMEIRKAVQGALFGPLQGQITSLIDTLGGPFQTGMSAVAGSIGRVLSGLGDVARQSASVRFVQAVFDTTSRSVDLVRPGLLAIVSGFRDLAAVALPIIERLAAGAGGVAQRFGEWLTRISESGQAVTWINNALHVLGALGQMLADVGGIIVSVFKAAQTAGSNASGMVGAVLDRVNRFLQSAQGQNALVAIFQGLQTVAAALSPTLTGIIGLLGQIAPIIAQVAVALGPGLASAVGLLHGIVAALGPALGSVAGYLSQAFTNPTFVAGVQALATGIAAALSALAPALPGIAQLAGTLGVLLGGALQIVAPLIGLLARALSAIAPVVGPIVVALAAIAGVVLAVVGPILAWIRVWMALTKVFAVVRTAWMILGIAFAASPIGLVITLIVGLVAAFIYLWTTSEGFRNFFTGIWGAIKSAAGAALSWLLGALSGLGSWLAGLPGMLLGALGSLGGLLLGALSGLGSFLAGLPGMILSGLAALPGMLGNLFLSALGLVLQIIGAGIGLILVAILVLPGLIWNGLLSLGSIIGGAFAAAWNWAVQASISAGVAIMSFVLGLPGMILGALVSLGAAIANAFTSAWSWAGSVTLSAIAAIGGFIAALPGRIGAFLAALPGIIGGAFSSALAWAQNAAIGGFNSIIGFIQSVPGRISALGGAMLGAGQRLIGAFFNGLKAVGGFAGDVASAIVSGIKRGLNWVISQLNSGIRSIWPGFAGSPPQIPSLARGGIITHRMVAEIGEAGPEVVIPLTKPRRAAELAERSGLIKLLADQHLLSQQPAAPPVPGRQVHVNAPITVHTLAADPLLVARRAADHVAVLATT